MKPFGMGVGVIVINTLCFDRLTSTVNTVTHISGSNCPATTLQMQAETHKFDLNNFVWHNISKILFQGWILWHMPINLSTCISI